MVKMAFRKFSPTGYLGPADGFHEYGTGPYPEYTVEDYEKQQTTNPNTLPRTLPGLGRGLADLLKGIPRGSRFYDYGTGENRGAKGFTGVLEGKEGVDIDPDFFQSDFYKTYNDPKYTKPDMPRTMDYRPSQYFNVAGDQRDLDAAYDRFLKARDSGEPVQIPDPITPPQFNQNPFMGGFGRSPFMGGFGRSPFMGGYGSPFGGLGMFGMSPYGGYGGYGMFGGMMNPFMGGMGGFGQMQPYRGNLPFERRMRFPQQPQQPQEPSTNFGTDSGTGLSPPSTQQPFQSPNPFMNPFMSGLGSMMGNMFSGGYGSNVSNTQANVAQ